MERKWHFLFKNDVTCQDPLSIEFSRQEYWSGLPHPPPGDLPDPGIEPKSLASPALTGRLFTTSTTWEAQNKCVISFFGLFISLSNGNVNVSNKPKRKLHAFFKIQIWRCYQSKAGILQCVRMWEVKRDPAQLCVPESLAEGSCDHLYSAGAGSEMQKDKHVFQTTHRVMWLGQESTCADCLFSAVLLPSSRKVARDRCEISLLGPRGSECRFL